MSHVFSSRLRHTLHTTAAKLYGESISNAITKSKSNTQFSAVLVIRSINKKKEEKPDFLEINL